MLFPVQARSSKMAAQNLTRIMRPAAEQSHPGPAQGLTECAGFCSNRASNYLG